MNKSRLLLSLVLIILPACLNAQEMDDVIDNEIDMAKGTKDYGIDNAKGNFIVVPIPILNPTIGAGLQPVVLYLHAPKEGGEGSPNATTGAGAMYTDSRSWVAGLFHDDYLFQDHLRVKLAIGTGELNVKYFGSGSDPIFADNPIEYSLGTDVYFAQVLGRLPWTDNWFGGVKTTVLNTEIAFDLAILPPEIPNIAAELDIVSLAVVLTRDTRDNNYYPTKGSRFEAFLERNDESLGSDFNFNQDTFSYNHYFPVTEKDVLAVRFYTSQIRGNAPFFLRPTLKMRGFASGLYQDDASMSAHLEWRHKFRPRWGFMLSLEAGRVAGSIGEMSDSDTISSVGAGIRWQVSDDQSMHLGVDVGFSQDDHAISIQIGEKF